MASWYEKYKKIFEISPEDIPNDIVTQIKDNLSLKISDSLPLASVVVIAHNEEKRILSCLWSLSDCITSFPIEIIVIDNNSTDSTTQLLDRVGVKWYEEKRKGPGYARQAGLEKALGKYYICIDSDTLYPPHYIETHIRCLEKEDVVCVSSTYSFLPNKKYSLIKLRSYEILRDLYNIILNIKRPELCVRGAVFSFNIKYGRKIGFKTDILRGEDGSLAFSLMKKYGKYVYIKSRKARAITSSSFFDSKDSFFSAFKSQILKAFSSITYIFYKKDEYKDDKSNLIK